ncbi:hypothetical protein C8R45DRAFT_186017 [Mycena sanguinolenta]|nr:hypothetical protein C8R45DRAFT_186017 [Mycena sanguinolenta]
MWHSISSSLLPTPTQTAEVLELLRTNSIPNNPFGMHSVIASCSADVVGYDTEIERLKQTLGRLVSERDTLQRHIDKCRSNFAPMRRLPRKSLRRYSRCADGTQSIPVALSVSFGQSHLMRLLHVCSAWHTRVVTAPVLWANLEVDLDVPLSRTVDNLSRLLDRSGHCSLALHLTVSTGRFKHSLELLARCATRWRIADLHLGNKACSLLSRVTEKKFHRLEALAIGGAHTAHLDLFEMAPNLRHVIISDVDDALPKLPW